MLYTVSDVTYSVKRFGGLFFSALYGEESAHLFEMLDQGRMGADIAPPPNPPV